MKDFIDKYGNTGKATNDRRLHLTAHYQTHGIKTESIQYFKLENNNGKSVTIPIDKLKEVIDILNHFLT